MPRIRLLASALALAICSISTAAASSAPAPAFDGVISFGDSLSDVGNIAKIKGLPDGFSFTTNPDPVAIRIIAGAFGFSSDASLNGGTNFAFGGACVQPNSATFTCGLSPGSFSLTSQVTGYLAATGGAADPNALYTMWGGANDLFTYAALAGAGAINSEQAAVGVATSAGTEVALVNALQGAGAGNIILFNLPNIAVTPDAASQATAAGEATAAFWLAHGDTPAEAAAKGQAAAEGVLQGLSQLSLVYNGQLNAGMSGKTGIIPVDTFGLVNEVLANPTAYGFTNVTDRACGPAVPQLTSVACGPAGSGLPFTYAAGTDMSYFFADGVHPTGGAQALLAQAVLAEIEAPSIVSMLAETPLQVFQTTTRGIHDQLQADRGSERADGSLSTFASVDFSHQRYDATASSPETSSRDSSLVIGGDYRVNSGMTLGLVSTFTHQDASFGGGGGFQNNEPMISAYGLWHSPEFYISLLGSLGQLNFNGIDRVIQLGAMTRTETGSTSGSHSGFELAGGYTFHWGSINSGPFASISHERVRIGSYNENGNDSTAMVFGRQNRDSTISKIGWELSGDSTFHPFARVAYEHESDADPRFVSAGLVGLNGTFSMPGYQPDSSYWSGELGMAAQMGNGFSGYAAYAGHFGDSAQRVDSFNLGLKWNW